MKLTAFKGIKPRTSPRLLDDVSAQIASNVNLSSGEMRPTCIPEATYAPNKTGPLLAIYKADDLWFSWPYDVDVCRSPLPGTIKWIYTGDGEPRITTAALAVTGGTGDDWPASCRALGVPKPITAPTVTPSGGALTDVTRYYAYTFYDEWNQESAFSPLSAATTGKPDGTWGITTLDAAPPNSGALTALSYVGTTVTITNAATTFTRAGERIVVAGVTDGGVTSVNGTWTITAVDVALKTISFVVDTAPTGTWTAGGTWAREAPWAGSVTKRLYRTSGTKAQFQLVAQGIAGTSYSDTLLDTAILGDEAISATWELPPVDLAGVFTLPSGALCGFSGNEICFSEPFQPHAWPTEYRKRSKYPVVAVGLFTSGLVVGTTGAPDVVVGHEPGQMSMQPVTGAYPCLSKRSLVSLGDSVGYASAHGYARIGENGVDLMTVGDYTRDDWIALAPETMIAETVRGRLYLMTQGQGPQMLVFDYLDGTGLTTSDIDATELFADPLSGSLYLSDRTNQDIREFDPSAGVYLSQDWMSKEFVLPEPVNLGAARVNFESRWSQAQYDALLAAYNTAVAANTTALASGDVGGEVNGDEMNLYEVNGSDLRAVAAPDLEAPGITFTLYIDGLPIYSKLVPNNRGFVLPSGYKSDTFAVRVQGQSQIKSIDLAQSLKGLKDA